MGKEKIINILSSRKFQIFLLVLIILVGLFFRILRFYKSGGLWLDEIYSYYQAKHAFPFGILKTLYYSDVHPPIYFFILHFWIKLFGHHDAVLRLLSVLFGVLTIPVVYLAGLELSSKKVGFTAALLTSLNSFLIYYSQEVRFYSLVALLGALSALFILKVRNNPTKLNYIGLALTNIAMIYTFTIGFIYVFIQLFIFSVYLYFKDKNRLKPFILSQMTAVILFLPYVPTLRFYAERGSQDFMSYYIFFKSEYLLYIIQNWFSPILNNMIMPNLSYYQHLFAEGIDFGTIIFLFIPVLIQISCLIAGTIKQDKARFLFYISILFVMAEITQSMLGKLVLISRYTILILPTFLIIISYGLCKIKNKAISVALISILILINLSYLIFNPNSAPKLPRYEGIKTVATVLQKYPVQKNDLIIMPYGGTMLSKYYNNGTLSAINIFKLPDRENSLFFETQVLKKITPKNSYELLKPYLNSSEPLRPLKKLMTKEISKLNKGNCIIIVLAPALQTEDSAVLKEILKNDQVYKNMPIAYLSKIKIINDIFNITKQNCRQISYEEKSGWVITIWEKTK